MQLTTYPKPGHYVAVIGVVAEDAEEGALEEGGGIGGVPFSQGDD